MALGVRRERAGRGRRSARRGAQQDRRGRRGNGHLHHAARLRIGPAETALDPGIAQPADIDAVGEGREVGALAREVAVLAADLGVEVADQAIDVLDRAAGVRFDAFAIV